MVTAEAEAEAAVVSREGSVFRSADTSTGTDRDSSKRAGSGRESPSGCRGNGGGGGLCSVGRATACCSTDTSTPTGREGV